MGVAAAALCFVAVAVAAVAVVAVVADAVAVVRCLPFHFLFFSFSNNIPPPLGHTPSCVVSSVRRVIFCLALCAYVSLFLLSGFGGWFGLMCQMAAIKKRTSGKIRRAMLTWVCSSDPVHSS